MAIISIQTSLVVLRSLNYYPIGEEKAEEGIASLALGLGKYIVDGGQTLRVCPFHPNQVLQMSEMEIALRETQTQFYALDMKHISEDFKVDDGFNILKLRVKDAEVMDSLQYIVSTYSPEDNAIYDGLYEGWTEGYLFLWSSSAECLPTTRVTPNGNDLWC